MDQELQNLHYCHGYKAREGLYTSCLYCDKTWTAKDMVADYIVNTGQVDTPDQEIEEHPKKY